jgi:arylsulfatase A-like enzyme
VALLIEGPGFSVPEQISEIVGLIDIAPTLLEAAGVAVPAGWKGRSLMPLVHSTEERKKWPNQQFVQISESMTGRTTRTRDWTYCVADTSGATDHRPPQLTTSTSFTISVPIQTNW